MLGDSVDFGYESPYRAEASRLEILTDPLPVGRLEDRLLVKPLINR